MVKHLNTYAEGTLEWHAYGQGYDYGLCCNVQSLTPLSGEWAGSPLPHDVIREAWRNVMGDSWGTYADGDEEDRDLDDSILDAWEDGYSDSFIGRRPAYNDAWSGNADTDKYWSK